MPAVVVALLVALGLTGAAPGRAAATPKVKVEALEVKRGGILRGALKTKKPAAATRVKNVLLRPLRALKPERRKQHAFSPVHPGDVRVFDIVFSNGVETTSTRTLTQRVSEVRIQNGRLRAQISQTWETDGDTSTTHHVQEVSEDGMLPATAEKLAQPPNVPIRIEGVDLPKKLSPGKTWSSRISWEANGASVDWQSQGRVVRTVRQAGPDRTMRDGVEIEVVSRGTSTLDGKVHETTTITRSVYLKGLGEVESTTRTEGQPGTMTRRLVGFTPGRVPG